MAILPFGFGRPRKKVPAYYFLRETFGITCKGVKSLFDVYVYSRGVRSLVPSTTASAAGKYDALYFLSFLTSAISFSTFSKFSSSLPYSAQFPWRK